MANEYSSIWFETFLDTISPTQTETEVNFLSRNLPLPNYQTLLDLGCGSGRHAYPLATRGYQVTGIDLNEEALTKAPKLSQDNPNYLPLDIRNLNTMSRKFNAVLSLWQSFGYFDNKTNQDLIAQISHMLTPQGRFVLDIYNSDFFKAHLGSITFEKEQKTITETKTMSGNRLTVRLDYGENEQKSEFNWQIFTQEEISNIAKEANMKLVLACTNFEGKHPVSPDKPRMQLVFEKVL